MNKTIVSIGAGYVGTPTMAVCAKHCPEYKFICVDHNERLIDIWNSDYVPIYEPGLEKIIKKVKNVNLFFTNNIEDAINQADIIFLSVCTPTKTFGIGANMACDLSYLEDATKKIRDISKKYKVIVEKSTVPVGTGVYIQDILNNNIYNIKYDVISNPEFLAEGTAISDLENPHRVLIGCNHSDTSKYALGEIIDIYNHWIPPEKIVTTDRWSSELSKLASNAFLAQRVSSINAMSIICEKIGGNVVDISKILGMDERIGKYFLNSSVGFGGSCFQKDILDLVYLCDYHNLPEVSRYWRSVIEINELQKKRFSENIIHALYDSIKNKHIAIFGFSFKKNSGDTRESPSISVCNYLIKEGAILHIYDPKVPTEKIYEELNTDEHNTQIIIESDCYKACKKVEAIVIITGWDVFKTLDYEHIYELMDHPSYIFDGCNILDKKTLEKYGFRIYTLGKYENV